MLPVKLVAIFLQSWSKSLLFVCLFIAFNVRVTVKRVTSIRGVNHIEGIHRLNNSVSHVYLITEMFHEIEMKTDCLRMYLFQTFEYISYNLRFKVTVLNRYGIPELNFIYETIEILLFNKICDLGFIDVSLSIPSGIAYL